MVRHHQKATGAVTRLLKIGSGKAPQLLLAIIASSLLLEGTATAQMLPDDSLGAESSTLTNGLVDGLPATLIEGGAPREQNLFHSFQDFNVDVGQRVYFANPLGIENILSRVTGNQASAINGVLGIDGAANLFLLNPNGIVFGENAVLDIEGSFHATTAEAISLGEGVFSAVAPESSSLLAVNPNVMIESYLTAASGDIENRGQIVTGQDLTLAANRLDLQGQIAAAGDLTMFAIDAVQIRDAVDVLFVALAGGDLLVQGNAQVNIVALSHPDSGLYSYGDMVLRSANPIGGDAHYWSVGGFRVETLEGNAGSLFSPIDPIIRTFGDVEIDEYNGTSLHILAGGSVTLGTAIIAAPDQGLAGVDFLQEVITLSNGESIEVNGGVQPTLDIRAGVLPEAIGTPPINILAGFDPDQDIFSGNFMTLPDASSADIMVGNVLITAPNGLVFFTNQYQPNTSLASGNILLVGDTGIETAIPSELIPDIVGDGLSFFADSRNIIEIISEVSSSSLTGNSGNISILADENIIVINGGRLTADALGEGDSGNILLNVDGAIALSGQGTRVTSDIRGDAIGEGGNIVIRGNSLRIDDRALIKADTLGIGNSGRIILEIEGSVEMLGPRNAIISNVGSEAVGNSGGIEINAESFLLDDSFLSAISFGKGDAGDITIQTRNSVDLRNFGRVNLQVSSPPGNGGDINIRSNTLSLRNGSRIQSFSSRIGDPGDIRIDVDESIILENGSFIRSAVGNNGVGSSGNILIDAGDLLLIGDRSFVGSVLGNQAIGNSGDILIQTPSLLMNENSQISTLLGNNSNGSSGQIRIQARDLIRLSGRAEEFPGSELPIFTRISSSNFGDGDGGDIEIITNNLELIGDSQITNGISGQGKSGDIRIKADSISMLGFQIQPQTPRLINAIGSRVENGGSGRSGDLFIDTNSLSMRSAQISASLFGRGRAGNVTVNARNLITLENNSSIISNVSFGGEGEGGNIFLYSENIFLRSGSGVNAIIRGPFDDFPASQGTAGNIFINVDNTLSISGVNALTNLESNIATSIDREAQGEGGTVNLNASSIEIIDGAIVLSTLDAGAVGTAGDIEIVVEELLIGDGGQLSTTTFSQGNAGEIRVDAQESIIIDGNLDFLATGIASRTENEATGNGGEIQLRTRNLDLSSNAQITTETSGAGNAGRIFLEGSSQISLSDESSISASTSNNSSGTGGPIQATTRELILSTQSSLSSESQGTGAAGGIDLIVSDQINLSNSDLTTSALNASGGNISVNQGENFVPLILLRDDSDITTNSFGDGGNINLNGLVIAFDDSDIIARSETGFGGNITLGPFFSETLPPDTEEPFDGDGQVDLNADGFVAAGQIITSDVSFIENSLTTLEEAIVDTMTLTAGSCLARTDDTEGSFVVTGTDGLPQQPGSNNLATFPTGEVRHSAEPVAEATQEAIWRFEDPVLEPTGVYELNDGRLVLSRECS